MMLPDPFQINGLFAGACRLCGRVCDRMHNRKFSFPVWLCGWYANS
jgi:hypothetical protein